MTDYFADRIAILKRELSEAGKDRKTLDAPWRSFPIASKAKELTREFEKRSIYAFERSALNAASDLRIDTPDRLDRVVSAVLTEPAQLYFEAREDDRSVIAKRLRGLVDVSDEEPGPQRWAAFVDIDGQGRLSYRTVRTRTRAQIMADPELVRQLAEDGQLDSKPSSMLLRAAGIGGDSGWIDLDIRHRTGMTKAEFEFALNRMGKGADPLLDRIRERMASGTRVRAASDAGWQMVRFRDYLRPRRGSVTLEDIHDGVVIIALLALLNAKSDDIKINKRPAGSVTVKTKAKGRMPKAVSVPDSDGLAVVRLNIEDRGLRALYSEAAPATEGAGDGSGGGGSRVRHPVRGHLFLARNGLIVWRKPHWRGSLDVQMIAKVVAPSHR